VPRYFFHCNDGAERLDADGVELPNLTRARGEAVVFMGERLKDVDGAFWGQPAWRMWVTDESGATVCELNVSGK
jgi:hypothetical protein